jgi:hypothetical protein
MQTQRNLLANYMGLVDKSTPSPDCFTEHSPCVKVLGQGGIELRGTHSENFDVNDTPTNGAQAAHANCSATRCSA